MSRSVSAPSSVTNTSPCWNGLIVPGSTLMYGSSLRLVTRIPREARIAARDEAAMPFPSEETTPPVTNTNLVIGDKFRKFQVYMNRSRCTNRESLRTGAREAACEPFDRSLATHEREHCVDRGCLRGARYQRAHRHHHLWRLELVL